ncbi:acetate kinase [Aequorivita sp. H23M31]|uniref:Acetate kinase n=1 Tax=Aequorivita ciconiae TaxID=2494375 RepID=A0A410G761_9FLAO|nr:acetate kinase [Aequorivita sp. H23M31]QAA83139.1 acetate kinase [Aequorivita sp. H23M31]
MNILVINSGSSSIKFQLIQMPSEEVICSGMVERVGHPDAVLKYKTSSVNINQTLNIDTHADGLKEIVELLLDPEKGVIRDTSEIAVVGHRVVHGGNAFSNITFINDEVKKEIQKDADLAPLHNPPNLEGILVAEKLFPLAKQVAVFDTAFHQTIPLKAKKYALPNELHDEGIQVYGFHGISHKYVSEKAIDYLRLTKSKIITIHLGNGCSMTAVLNGESVDHSMGFGTTTGLIMGTRSGDIDHSIIFYLVNSQGYNLDDVNNLITKKSGMLGLTGHSDLRDIEAEAEKGNEDCLLALHMNAYRIKKYIGSFAAVMNGVDAIVFTGGIGENSTFLRNLVCSDLEYLNIHLAEDKNAMRLDEIREINTSHSKTKVLIVPTREELEIAKQAFRLISN